MKKLFTTILLVLFLGFKLVAQQITLQDIQSTADVITKTLCPVMIDSETRFDKCTAFADIDNNLVVQYNYTLINTVRSSYSDDFVESIKSITKVKLTNSLRTSDKNKIIRDNNLIVSYVYHDKNGNIFMIIKITPDVYNSNQNIN